MYTSKESGNDWDGDSMVDIIDPDGIVVCRVLEWEADALLSHLNRG